MSNNLETNGVKKGGKKESMAVTVYYSIDGLGSN